MRIALLGGSFDPVHNGHLLIAESALSSLSLDLVVFVPSFRSPHKDGVPGADGAQRLAMLRAAAAGNRRFVVDDCEIRREGVSYTIDTIADLETRYAVEGKVHLLLGDDLAAGFSHWRKAEELAARTVLVLASRGGGTDFPFPHLELGNPKLSVSSTELRSLIPSGNAWRSFMPSRAASLIEEWGLYGYGAHPGATLAAAVDDEARRMLSVGRYAHSRSTAVCAVIVAERAGLEPDNAFLAGLAHDLAKELPLSRVLELVSRDGAEVNDFEAQKASLLHGRASAVLLRERFGVTDEEVLDAIRWHTSGRIGMGPLAKAIYLADKIEWTRREVSSAFRRELLESPLDDSFLAVFRANLSYLRESGKRIDPRTLDLAASLDLEVAGSGQ